MKTHGDPAERRRGGRAVPPEASVDRAVRDPRRLRSVRRSGLTEGAHPNLERYTRMAAAAIGAPVSLFSVLDASRQHFVVQVGIVIFVRVFFICGPISRWHCIVVADFGVRVRFGVIHGFEGRFR